MGSADKFCLRWNDFESNISTSFQDLLTNKDLLDVTIAVGDGEGRLLQAHKVVLAACSPLLRNIFCRKLSSNNDPVLYLRGIKFQDIKHVLDFMYHGEVNVAQADLNSFLAVAEELQIKGLTQNDNGNNQAQQQPKREGVKRSGSDCDTSGSSMPNPAKRRPMGSSSKRVANHPPIKHASNVPQDDDDEIEDVTPIKCELASASSDVADPSSSAAASAAGGGGGGDYAEDEDYGQYGEGHEDYDEGNMEGDDEEPLPGTSSDGSKAQDFRHARGGHQDPLELGAATPYREIEGERKSTTLFWAGDNGYIKDYLYKGKILLKCRHSRRPWFCAGRGFIVDGFFHPTKAHSCGSVAMDAEIIEARSAMKQKAELTSASLRDIFNDVSAHSQEEVAGNIAFSKIVHSLRKRRRRRIEQISNEADLVPKVEEAESD